MESSLQTIKSLRAQLKCIGEQNKCLTRKVVRPTTNKLGHKNKSRLIFTHSDAEVQTNFNSFEYDISLPVGKEKQEFSHLVKCLVQRSHQPKYCDFSTFLKEFGMKLHYYSPRGYEFVRWCLNNVLPHPKSFQIWTAGIETKPGFIPASLLYMKRRNEESKNTIFHAVSFDEMNIRKQVIFHAGVMKGYIDYGDIYELPPSETIATHALFIKVNEINCTRKTVLGYILTNGLTAELMEQLIRRTLMKLHENSITVLTVTFDGLPSNFAAAANLGANFDICSKKFQSHIVHPVTGENVYFIPDPCHMFKLLRNMLDAYGELVDSNGQDIKWLYFGRLMELQRAEGLRANKVTPRHVNFSKQKMKVKLAVQLFRNSVSVSLRVCEKLYIPGFQRCPGTANFVRLANRLFDTLNSRPTGERDMEPLSKRNIHSWKPLFEKMKLYLMGLKRKSTGQLISKTKRNTCIVGLVVAISSLESIMENIVLPGKTALTYIPVYKLSQDVLELFFSVLWQMFGNNNNPNVIELEFALKRILAVNINRSLKGNCLPQEQSYDTAVVSPLTGVTHRSKEADEAEEIPDMPSYQSLSLYVFNVVAYLSGFVGMKIAKKLDCEVCALSLVNCDSEWMNSRTDFVLINEKNNGGLFTPSEDLILTCKITENVIREIRSFRPKEGVNFEDILSLRRLISAQVFSNLRSEYSDDHDPMNENHVW